MKTAILEPPPDIRSLIFDVASRVASREVIHRVAQDYHITKGCRAWNDHFFSYEFCMRILATPPHIPVLFYGKF
jgi:hypothetical protein